MNARAVLSIGAFAAGVVLLVAVAPRLQGTPTDEDAPAVAPRAANAPPRVPIRSTRPDAPVPIPDLVVTKRGAPYRIAGPRPRPALLHLWATWCGPCREELPVLLAYGRANGVDVVAVSVDDRYESVTKYFAGTQMPDEIVWDERIVLEGALGVASLPTTFLVDRAGNARLRFNGMQDWASAEMGKHVADELARTPPQGN